MNCDQDLFQWFYALSITNYILKSTCKKWEINRMAVYQRIKQKVSKAWFHIRLWLCPCCSMPLCASPHSVWKGQLLVRVGLISVSYKWHQWKSWLLNNTPPASTPRGEKLASWGVIWLSCFRLRQVLSSFGVLGVFCPKSSYYSAYVLADQIKLPAIQIWAG